MKTHIGLPILLAGLIFFTTRSGADSQGIEQGLLSFSNEISSIVEDTGDRIDMILAGDRYTKKVNNSNLNVSGLATWREGHGVNASPDFGFNLRLPNFERRWQLRFSSYDEEQESRNLNQSTVRTVPRTTNFGTGLFLFHKFGAIRTTFQPRLQLKNPLDMSYFLNFTTSAEGRRWRLEPKLQLFADSRKSTGEYWSLGLMIKRIDRLEYSLQSEEEYDQMTHFFSTRHGFITNYKLSDSQSLSTAIIASSENHPFHLSLWNLSVTFGQRLYPRLLSCSLSPFLGFAKSDQFKGKAGISFSLDATF